MRFLIEAHHPSDIHFWKYTIRELQDRGHWVLMLARDRDVMVDLVKKYPWIVYEVVSTLDANNRFPLKEFLQRQYRVAECVARCHPHAIASISGSYTQASSLLRVPNLVFSDSEHQHFNHAIAHPFARRIYTPKCYTKHLGSIRKWIRYRGIHELAYLGKGQFEANSEGIVEGVGVELKGYVAIRLSSWNTLHDIGAKGLGGDIDSIIQDLLRSGLRPVIVAEENKLPEQLQEYRSPLPAHRYHDLLAHAAFVVTEGASTASEAACLGVYSVYVNSLMTGYLLYLEKEYALVSCHRDSKSGVAAIRSFLRSPISPSIMAERRNRLLEESENMVDFVADAFEREGGKFVAKH